MNKAANGDGQTPAKADGDTFANTRKHVAEQQADGATVERFANTKLNIALINDPKNGPRFTLTKREAGLADEGGGEKTPDHQEPAEERAATTTPSDDTADTPPVAAVTAEAEPSSDQPDISEAKAEIPKPATEPGSLAKNVDRPATPTPAEQASDKVQVDSTKIFVGHNGTFYDESWRWMDWRGTRQSWNWPAALSLGHWFAYRRLHGYASLYILWLAALAASAVNGVPILALVVLALLGVGVTGVYGNTLYFLAFRRAVAHVTKTGEGSYDELQDQLAAAGGTSVMATGVMGALSLAGITAALALTYNLRGGFSLNFWPFS